MQVSQPITLTRAQLALELGVSIFTLNQWAVSGKGPKAIRVGRQSVYRREEVDAYKALRIDGSQVSAAPQPVEAYMMRLPEVLAVTGLSKSTVYSMAKAGTFPSPVKLGARAVAWPSHLVQQWLADRVGGNAA